MNADDELISEIRAKIFTLYDRSYGNYVKKKKKIIGRISLIKH